MPQIHISHPSDAQAAIAALTSATPVFTGPTPDRVFSSDSLETMFGSRRRRPEWTWLATGETGEPMGVVAAMSPTPTFNGFIVVDMHAAPDPDIAAALYERILRDSEHLGLTEPIEMTTQFSARPNPVEDPGIAPYVQAAERAGWETLVIRRRFEIQADTAPDPIPTDLRFETPPSPDDPRLLSVMTDIMDNTLDAHDQRDLLTMTPDAVARQSLGYYLEADPLEGFSLAYTPANELAGLVIGGSWPNKVMGSVGFVGVHPEHRGNGYAAQLTSAKARELVATGVQTIVGDTDEQNTPMSNAFEDAGFTQTETRIDFMPRT